MRRSSGRPGISPLQRSATVSAASCLTAIRTFFRGDESIKDWDSLKNKEKGRLTLADDLESVPGALPALMRAAKL